MSAPYRAQPIADTIPSASAALLAELAETELVSARDVLAWRRTTGRGPLVPAPALTILTLDRTLFEVARRRFRGRSRDGLSGELLTLGRTGHRVGVFGCPGMGAPAMAIAVEELTALGATALIAVGTAGALTADLAPTTVIVATGALRDEGVSGHYLPPGPTVEASAELTGQVIDCLRAVGIATRSGLSWTTDACYRETRTALVRARARGALVVEMEAAALFAVGRRRGIRTAAVLVVADSLAREPWQGPTDPGSVQDTLAAVLGALVGLRP